MKYAVLTNIQMLLFGILLSTANAEDWTRFRGPNGSGVYKNSTAPTSWDVEPSTNLKWSVSLQGPGSSCPIVFGDRVYLTCYTGYGIDAKKPGNPAELKRHLLCFDRESGKEIWKTTVDSEHDEVPYSGFITHHGYASSTPVTDGERIFVQFGKTGLFAFDRDGKRIWKTNVGTLHDPAKWGNGASCVVYKDLVIINAGNTGHAIIALKQADGSEVWRVLDDNFTNSWTTPILVQVDGHDELIINMPKKILAYDPNDGRELWWSESPIQQTVCGSCVADENGVVYAMGGREGAAIAVRSGGQGNVTETHIVWKNSLRSGINTPLIADGKLYWLSGGIAYCADCKTGDYVYRERLPAESSENQPAPIGPSGDYASPVVVGDKLLLLTKNGSTHVLKIANEYLQLGFSQFDGDSGRFNATPAVTDREIFVRSDSKLYCIAEKSE
jgi:hypothetical protein